jgi:3-oxoacyl-[acyl-carrier-protein] synthase-3
MTVCLTGLGTYVPEGTITGAEIAARSGIPEDVVVEKMGLREKRVCPPDDDHVTDMGVAAARDALDDADCAPTDLDAVVYHGSEFKDHVVWSAAAAIADRLGADDAYAVESYALCAGAPLAMRGVVAQLHTGDVDRVLLVGASREEDLVEYTDADSSFMFNFGSGASAMVVERDPGDRARAVVHDSAAVTDGSFSDDVVMPAGGSDEPPSHVTVDANRHHLTVPDPEGLKERLGAVSLDNFTSVADHALERSGLSRADVDFLALVHMKRSFTDLLFDRFGLDLGRDGYYLDDYGHVQSADQGLALQEGLDRGRVNPGDVVLFLAAGTGYTWGATALTWRG